MRQRKSFLKIFLLTVVMATVGLSFTAHAAGVKIGNIEHDSLDGKNQITINLNDELSGVPDLQVRPNLIQLEIPGSYVWPQVEKKVSLGGEEYDSTIKAYQFTKDIVRFRAVLPFNAENIEDQVSVMHKGDQIRLVFPRGKNAVGNTASTEQMTANQKQKASPQESTKDYDEGYLNQLLKEKKEATNNSGQQADALSKDFPQEQDKSAKSPSSDEVNVTLSGEEKASNRGKENSKSSFSIMGYVGKFVAFLALVLAFFYGVVTLLKKGVLKKGKLTLFNDTNVIEVLTTTYLGPKKSLMLVKAHNQVFLVASTEKGFEFLSEIKDTTGLFKEGEKQIAGDNFDTSLSSANNENQEFKIKDPEQEQSLSSFLNGSSEGNSNQTENTEKGNSQGASKVEDQVKLSDQIKSKMKDLKQLQ